MHLGMEDEHDDRRITTDAQIFIRWAAPPSASPKQGSVLLQIRALLAMLGDLSRDPAPSLSPVQATTRQKSNRDLSELSRPCRQRRTDDS